MLFTNTPKRYSHYALVYWKPQIRLLKVEPDYYGQVRCKVEIFDLDKAPVYAALSYTWGPESPVYDILIDGKTLPIRRNLHQFLKCWRKETSKHIYSYLFIDQICIDQSDPEERSRQVQLMSQIYSKCWHVVLWLNDEQGQCTKAARAFSHLSKRTLSLAKLLRNDYFTRLWIVQELLLAPSIRVFTPGNKWLRWPIIQETTRAVMSGTLMTAEESAAWKLVPVNTTKLILMTNKFSRRTKRDSQELTSLEKLSWMRFAAKSAIQTKAKELLEILDFSANICHEPRDKVYGLMSLLNVEHQLTVDYDKPIYDVFKEAVIGLHSVIDFEVDKSYERWIEAAQQLGTEMGIGNEDIAELFALLDFVNLILPCRSHIAEEDTAGLPSLVSMVSVKVSVMSATLTHGTTCRYGGGRVAERSVAIEGTEGIHNLEPDGRSLKKYLGLPPGLRYEDYRNDSVTKSHSNQAEATKTLQYDIIREVAQYCEQEEGQDPVWKKEKWSLFVQSITQAVSLRDKGLDLSWYYHHNGKRFKYVTPPNWDSIFRISPFRMSRIIKEYELERTNDEESRKEKQTINNSPQTASARATQQVNKEQSGQRHPRKGVVRAFRYLAYGWLGLAGFLLAILLVLWFIADTMSHIIPVFLGLWSFYRFAQRRQA